MPVKVGVGVSVTDPFYETVSGVVHSYWESIATNWESITQMADFTGQTPSTTYKNVIQAPTANAGLSTSLVQCQDGAGNNTPIWLATNAVALNDNTTFLRNTTDTTKQVKFLLSSITTGTIRTITIPDSDLTLVGTTLTQTITNKTINGSNNTITNIDLASQVTGVTPIANGGTAGSTATTGFDNLSPMTTLGDVIYGGASGSRSRLAGNITTTPKYLKSLGDGANAAAPSWVQPAAADISDYALSGEGTLGTLTWTGTAPTTLLNSVYRWARIGKIILFEFRIEYTTAGSGVTQLSFSLPGDVPVPLDFTGQGSSESGLSGNSFMAQTIDTTTSACRATLRKTGSSTYDVKLGLGSAAPLFCSGSFIYTAAQR